MNTIMLISPKDNNFYNFRSELILELKRKFRVILVCPYGKKIDYFTSRGCEFIRTDVDRRGTNPFIDIKLILKYINIIRKEKPDIVLTYTTKSGVYAGIACRLTGTNYIVNNAGLIVNENKSLLDIILAILYRLGYNGASCLMFQNLFERDYIRNICNKNIPFHNLPGSGVNTQDFDFQEYATGNEIYFNYVARIVEIKGINEYIECAKRIRSKYTNVHFLIYGDYDNDAYRTIIADLIEQDILEYGGVQMNMKPFIKKASAAIHPSHYEGMTNVILEHASMGRPSIASNIPGCREGVEDGKTGYLFECRNVDMMVEKVEQFIQLSYEQKAAMGRAAREKMEREFDRNIVTNIYIEEINRILKNKR